MEGRVNSEKWQFRLRCWVLLVGGAMFVAFLCVEFFLRWHYGFCDAVLMQEDDDYEYIAQPNQMRHRLGNDICYNSFSMRSEELRPGSLRILCVGDSVVNGGTLTDQTELATVLLEKRLTDALQKDIQVLNVSAGSWGPDNCAAYLKKNGFFDAKALILVTSSHDVHDTMTFVPAVGVLKYYPKKQYPLAVLELLDRYLYPNWRTPHVEKAKADEDFRKEHHIETTAIPFNPGFQQLAELANQHGVPFLIYLHASRPEQEKGSYDQDGLALIDFCEMYHIECIRELEQGVTKDCLRENDFIHCSPKGQAFMADQLYSFCEKVLK